MDLSQIPLGVLQAEHAHIDKMQSGRGFGMSPLCKHLRENGIWCYTCPFADDCDALLDSSLGWPERKERYLLALRAEIERRA